MWCELIQGIDDEDKSMVGPISFPHMGLQVPQKPSGEIATPSAVARSPKSMADVPEQTQCIWVEGRVFWILTELCEEV